MTKFKANKKDTNVKQNKGTLDQKHSEKMAQFEKMERNLPQKKDKLAKLKRELDDLINMNPNKYSTDDIRRKAYLMDTIDKLNTEIDSIENRTEAMNYISNVFPILVNYYDNGDMGDDEIEEDYHKDNNEGSRKNILSYFMKEAANNKKNNYTDDTSDKNITKNISDKTITKNTNDNTIIKNANDNTIIKNTNDKASTKNTNDKTNAKNTDDILTNKIDELDEKHFEPIPKINKAEKIKQKMNRAKLYENYLDIIDVDYRRSTRKKTDKCSIEGCGGEKILSSDGCMVCKKCAYCEPTLIATDKPNYKEPTQDSGTYAYKRINHLTEILSQLQAKESTDIPPYVFESIIRELKKRKIDKNDLDIFRLRRILKKLEFRKYYEHVPHILQIINGKEPPNFTRRDEIRIKKMFKDIQKPFAIYCPKNRKNFLNYSYVLHKFCELLGLDEYINYFPLLKNNAKLVQHDKIWKKICEYVKWEFTKSI